MGWLMSVPGPTNTVLEAVMPYSRMSMFQLLGKVPTRYCSQQTAEEMALLAYGRALKLSSSGSPGLGVGFTGSLASTHPKLCDHRFYLSIRTPNQLWISTVTLSKGMRTREQEDAISSHLLLKAIANACKLQATFVSHLTESDASNECEKQFTEDQELEQLIMTYEPNEERKIILSGSFNPLHEGHLKLLEVATSICGNGYRALKYQQLMLTNLHCQYHKSRIMSSNWKKLLKYYDGNYGKMIEILIGCKRTGCTFLGGRNIDGVFKVIEHLDIPEVLKDMFVPIPAEKFRMDISSTEIRKSRGLCSLLHLLTT